VYPASAPPEGELFALDARRSRERAGAENDRTAAAPLIFLGALGDLVLAGTVYVPIDPHARLVWIQVEIGMRRFPFCFEQTLTRVRS
jgi:hypothetical protein